MNVPMNKNHFEIYLCFRKQYPNPTADESLCAMLIAIDFNIEQDSQNTGSGKQ